MMLMPVMIKNEPPPVYNSPTVLNKFIMYTPPSVHTPVLNSYIYTPPSVHTPVLNKYIYTPPSVHTPVLNS